MLSSDSKSTDSWTVYRTGCCAATWKQPCTQQQHHRTGIEADAGQHTRRSHKNKPIFFTVGNPDVPLNTKQAERHTALHAKQHTVSRPSTPPAVRPFKPDRQMLSLLGAALSDEVTTGSAVVIWSMAVARLVTVAGDCLAPGNARGCNLSTPLRKCLECKNAAPLGTQDLRPSSRQCLYPALYCSR